jgi:hypothetical protein
MTVQVHGGCAFNALWFGVDIDLFFDRSGVYGSKWAVAAGTSFNLELLPVPTIQNDIAVYYLSPPLNFKHSPAC